MRNALIAFTCWSCLLFYHTAIAQDTIYTKEGKVILADISEVGNKTVTYTAWGRVIVKVISLSRVERLAKRVEKKETICAWEKNLTDEFTGDKILSLPARQLFTSTATNMRVGFMKVNEDFFITMEYVISGSRYIKIDEGHQLMIKLANDSIIKVDPAGSFSSETSYYEAGSITAISAMYRVSPEQLQLCAAADMRKLRFYTAEGYFEETSNEMENLPVIRSNIQCILYGSPEPSSQK